MVPAWYRLEGQSCLEAVSNEDWMSRLKAQHAEPAMSDLLLGKDVVIPESRARSIALFLHGRAAPSRFHRLIDLADVN